MNVLQISADRSKRGILYRGSPAYERQKAYAERFGRLDIIAFSTKGDHASAIEDGNLHIHPTNSSSRWTYVFDAIRIAKTLQKPDVVTSQDPFECGIAAWRITQHLNVPLHVQVHTDFLSPQYSTLSFINGLRIVLARFVLKRAARIRVVSNRVKESILQHYGLSTSISVLPIFVDVKKFRDAEPFDAIALKQSATFKYKLLVVSRDAPEKNIDLAKEAFEKSAPQDACLIIVGDFTDVQELGPRIYGMPTNNTERMYKSVDLVLVPSKYEGYGLVTIEALAAGKPVLSTDVGIADEAGAIVTTEDTFADRLAQWFKEDGPRHGELKSYPYNNFDEYVSVYVGDIKACIEPQNGDNASL